MTSAESLLFAQEFDDSSKLNETRRDYTRDFSKEVLYNDQAFRTPYSDYSSRTEYFTSIKTKVSELIEPIISDNVRHGRVDFKQTVNLGEEFEIPQTTLAHQISAQLVSTVCREAHDRVALNYQDDLLDSTDDPDQQDIVVDKIGELFKSESHDPGVLFEGLSKTLLGLPCESLTPEECLEISELWVEQTLKAQDFTEAIVVQSLGESISSQNRKFGQSRFGRWVVEIARKIR